MASGATLGGGSPSSGGVLLTGGSDGVAGTRIGGGGGGSSSSSGGGGGGCVGPGLYEFLIEAELQQYYGGIKNDLKVQNVSQMKYVTEEDLQSIGMSKPEMRRLKKFFQKHFPQNYLSKFKKMILPKREEQWRISLPPPEEAGRAGGRPPVKVPNKHIIPSEAIMVNKELGTGEFGVVQQGVWTNEGERIQVAIKCLSRERMQSNPIEFLKEAAIMHAIDHEHIVRLYGVVLDTNALMLVTELAPLRSLLECLKEPSLRPSFPVLSLCDFAIQICDGMQYLEQKRLIHRDLAARNILVFSKNKVKISDFGLSRALGVGKDYYQTNFNVNLKLPIAWCAPECITFLRFTSASDVWAFGVTLWEMFSYGFQPWAALTGHQILEAIDEPNFQRLEQPECCPKEYFSIMLRCWAHDPNKRPKFSELMTLLPECKPEQVQAVQEYHEDPVKVKREQLQYKVQDVITVLDKGPIPNMTNCWKGVLNNGKAGLFNPAHTVAYLGANLPTSVKTTEFMRGDGKNMYSSRRRLRPDMISSPQGDLKHTGHVGLDGAYFGDISFLGGKVTPYPHLPHQVVAPYKPQEDGKVTGRDDHPPLATAPSVDVTSSDKAPLLHRTGSLSGMRKPCSIQDNSWSDAGSEKGTIVVVGSSSGSSSLSHGTGSSNSKGTLLLADHEYHEISDEEDGAVRRDCKDYVIESDDDENGVESPRFEKSFDFGPSLMDEMDAMLRSLSGGGGSGSLSCADSLSASNPPVPAPQSSRQTPPLSIHLHHHHSVASEEQHRDGETDSQNHHRHKDDSTHNMRNELREMAAKMGGRKKQATVKPISAADQRTLESAIAMATEMASRSMLEAEGGGMLDEAGRVSSLDSPPHTPKTPASPSRRKFSFKFSGGTGRAGGSPRQERRNFAEEAASIQDIQSTLTEEAKAVYSSLVEQPALPPLLSPPPPAYSLSHHQHNHHHSDHLAHPSSPPGDMVDPDDTNPLRMLRSGFGVRPRIRGNKHQSLHASHERSQGAQRQQQKHASLGERNGRSLLPRPPSEGSGSCVLAPAIVGCALAPGDESVEEEGEEDAEEGNPIPLPPRDRSKPSVPDQPRHQRRHPLVFPGGGLSHALAKISFGGDVESSLDGVPPHPDQQPSTSDVPLSDVAAKTKRPGSPDKSPKILCNMDDSFENQIASELEALDDIPEEETATTSSPPSVHPQRHSVHVVHQSFPHPSQPPPPPPPTSVPPSTPSPTLPKQSLHSDEDKESSKEEEDEVDGNGDGQMLRNGDHVSCEDLLEFACDGPNVRRTRGRARGVDSDEVRIMGKVLGKEVSREACLSALNATDWDVHRAIKVVHLQTLLLASLSSSSLHGMSNSRHSSSSLPGTLDPMSAFEALSVCGWDVARAAGWYLAAREEGDTTEV